MLDEIPETLLDQIMSGMGYERKASKNGLVMYVDSLHPDVAPSVFDFRQGPLSREDVERHLEYNGVSLDVFYAELDAITP